MRNKYTAFIFIIILLIAASGVSATSYTLGEEIPGGSRSVEGIAGYARILFPFLILAAAALALVSFTIGAIHYVWLAGANPSKLDSAKDRMQGAILGLLLAVGSVLFMQTINPRFIDLQLDVQGAGGVRAESTSTCGGENWGSCPNGRCKSTNGGPPYSCEDASSLLAEGEPCPDSFSCQSFLCARPEGESRNICVRTDVGALGRCYRGVDAMCLSGKCGWGGFSVCAP